MLPHSLPLSPAHHPAVVSMPPPSSPGGMLPVAPYGSPQLGLLASPGRHMAVVAPPPVTYCYSLNPLQVGAVIGRAGSHITQVGGTGCDVLVRTHGVDSTQGMTAHGRF